jgi:hypothetical protein
MYINCIGIYPNLIWHILTPLEPNLIVLRAVSLPLPFHYDSNNPLSTSYRTWEHCPGKTIFESWSDWGYIHYRVFQTVPRVNSSGCTLVRDPNYLRTTLFSGLGTRPLPLPLHIIPTPPYLCSVQSRPTASSPIEVIKYFIFITSQYSPVGLLGGVGLVGLG